jgi:hypothetical protein
MIKFVFLKRLCVRPGKRIGFTYNKETKKLSLWFGANISLFTNNSSFSKFLKLYNHNWISNEPFLFNILTRCSLEKILNGKITNPIQLCKYYLRTSLKSKASPKLFYKYIKSGDCNNGNLYKLSHYFKVDNNHDNILNKVLEHVKPYKHLTDLIQQCLSLDKKINFNWSEKRFDLEHTNLTNEILKFELENIKNNVVNYSGELILPHGCELLTTQNNVFIEGRTQGHCIYSYWTMTEQKKYFIVRMYTPERCTIGIRFNKVLFKFVICQMYLKGNKDVKYETRKIIEDWLMNDTTQSFFKSNYRDNNNMTIFNNIEMEDVVLHQVRVDDINDGLFDNRWGNDAAKVLMA